MSISIQQWFKLFCFYCLQLTREKIGLTAFCKTCQWQPYISLLADRVQIPNYSDSDTLRQNVSFITNLKHCSTEKHYYPTCEHSSLKSGINKVFCRTFSLSDIWLSHGNEHEGGCLPGCSCTDVSKVLTITIVRETFQSHVIQTYFKANYRKSLVRIFKTPVFFHLLWSRP